MVGIDESTELWRDPSLKIFFAFFIITIFAQDKLSYTSKESKITFFNLFLLLKGTLGNGLTCSS